MSRNSACNLVNVVDVSVGISWMKRRFLFSILMTNLANAHSAVGCIRNICKSDAKSATVAVSCLEGHCHVRAD